MWSGLVWSGRGGSKVDGASLASPSLRMLYKNNYWRHKTGQRMRPVISPAHELRIVYQLILTWLQGCNQFVDVLPLLLARRNPSLGRSYHHQQPLLELFFGRFQSVAILVGDVGTPKLFINRGHGVGSGCEAPGGLDVARACAIGVK